MGDRPPQWMLDAAAALSTLDVIDSDGVEGWTFGRWAVIWPEGDPGDPEPGWEYDGACIEMVAGSYRVTTDIIAGDVAGTARRLLAGVVAFDGTPPEVHRLLRFASLQWHGAQTALLELYALRPPEGDPRLPGFEMVLDFLMSNAPCGNGPLDRAIANELGERSPFWYAHGTSEPPKPDETAVLVASLRARIAELEQQYAEVLHDNEEICEEGARDDCLCDGCQTRRGRHREREELDAVPLS